MTEYKKKLVEQVKLMAQTLIDNAEDIVGDTPYMTDFDIWLKFPQDYGTIPTIEVTKEYLPDPNKFAEIESEFRKREKKILEVTLP